MKIRALLLLLMIAWDASLHWTYILNIHEKYPLYINFPIFGLISYNIFWTCFWTFGFILMLTLIGNQVSVKHTTHIHNHPKEEQKEIAEDK